MGVYFGQWECFKFSFSPEFDFCCRESRHFQQDESVGKAADISASIGSFAILYRKVYNLEIKLVSAKQQVEISERVKFTEERAVSGQPHVI
ncbi:hypothetical protein [Anaerophaga thermohalophila]|uniref:hypothetical protein n=1 Tax=Anaerophaga thermohalophila TaxID=177400 RepID=UPI00035F9629|nr:hypothetical protein [Anaerophaga thermohalophila]